MIDPGLVVQSIIAILSMGGAWLVSSDRQFDAHHGYGLWLASNVLFIGYSAVTGSWPFLLMACFYCATSMRGWVNTRAI